MLTRILEFVSQTFTEALRSVAEILHGSASPRDLGAWLFISVMMLWLAVHLLHRAKIIK